VITNQAGDPAARYRLTVAHRTPAGSARLYIMYGDTEAALHQHLREVEHVLAPIVRTVIRPQSEQPKETQGAESP